MTSNMESKICKVCGKELPIPEFRNTRFGHTTAICKSCSKLRYNETRSGNMNVVKRNIDVFDADFDGKYPVEVLQIMKRAKMWLEARGYNITLKGTYTQVKDIKF